MNNVKDWLLDRVPAGLQHRPAEWAIAVLCVFSGLVALSGWHPAPSVSQTLPWPVYYAWATFLVVGGAALTVALSSIRQVGGNYIVRQVPAYRLSMRLLGTAWGVYAVCLLWVNGWGAAQAAVAPLVITLMCAVRLLTLWGGGRR